MQKIHKSSRLIENHKIKASGNEVNFIEKHRNFDYNSIDAIYTIRSEHEGGDKIINFPLTLNDFSLSHVTLF